MASVFRVHCPSFTAIVLATRGEVLRRPAHEPTSLTTDSRDELAGACFVALRGESFDGHAFVVPAACFAYLLLISLRGGRKPAVERA